MVRLPLIPLRMVDQRRVIADQRRAGLLAGELGEIVIGDVPRKCLSNPLASELAMGFVDHLIQDVVQFDVGIPDVERRHRSERRHPLPVAADALDGRVATLGGGKAVVTAGNDEARGQPFDVPLPRARERLVEIVDVEHDPAFRRGVGAEIQQVAVATNLHLQAGSRTIGQVGGHDAGRAAVERERRLQHPAIADRQQFRHTARARLDE